MKHEGMEEYRLFASRVYRLEAEPLERETLLFWSLFFLNEGIEFLKFIRRADGSFWIAAPGSSHRELMYHGGDVRSELADAGSIQIVKHDDGIDVVLFDDSGSLNLGKSSEERIASVLALNQMLRGVVRLIAAKP